MKIIVEEVDTLRASRKHDLLVEKRQTQYKEGTKRKKCFLVAGSPPCQTFSRALWANRQGPKPGRSRRYSRGFPWLRGKARRKIAQANQLVTFTVESLRLQMEPSPRALALGEHPEDLGKVKSGEPASIWQWDEVREIADRPGAITGALHQSDWGREYPKPTRLIGRLPGLETILRIGWPIFDEAGSYKGPLKKPPPGLKQLI